MRKTLNASLREYEANILGKYNSEVSRGIVHTDEWKIKMAGFQARFNEDQRQRVYAEAAASGASVEETHGGFFITPAPRRQIRPSGWIFASLIVLSVLAVVALVAGLIVSQQQ